MVFHKQITPADGERGIKTNRRHLILTKVVLEQENTAAALLVKTDGNNWTPLEFLNSNDHRTGNINIKIPAGETLFLKCREEACWGTTKVINGSNAGGQVRLHVYGNFEEVHELQPERKRARHGGENAEGFQEGRAETLRP